MIKVWIDLYNENVPHIFRTVMSSEMNEKFCVEQSESKKERRMKRANDCIRGNYTQKGIICGKIVGTKKKNE